MRIIVGRDYYDSGMAYGHDESLTFVRARDRWIQCKDLPFLEPYFIARLEPTGEKPVAHIARYLRSWTQFSFGQKEYCLAAVQVVICGVVYNGVKVDSGSLRSEVFWTLDSLRHYLNAFHLTVGVTKPEFYRRYTNVEDYFTPYKVVDSQLTWLIENKITILTYEAPGYSESSRWRINGDNLKNIGFMKVMDPFTLFQEIEMWIGGVLPGAGNPMVEITDQKIKVAKHGFDEWSFRKKPESGKRK
jgi:hypothetical protein